MGLFNYSDVKNKPSRSGFDLSHKTAFTAKVGELLPVWHKTVMPGDKFNISVNHVTRTMPVETAAFTRFREYFDYFFVPYRQLYKVAPSVFSQMQLNPTYAQNPTINAVVGTGLPSISTEYLVGNTDSILYHICNSKNTNFAGFYHGYTSTKLFNHLGYGYTSEDFADRLIREGLTPQKEFGVNIPLSLFPLAAYQKIYFDFYRFQQWENNNPVCYNFDYLSSSSSYEDVADAQTVFDTGLFNLRYCNFNKDLFFGMLPKAQLGETSTVVVDGSLNRLQFDANTITTKLSSTTLNASLPNNYANLTFKDSQSSVSSKFDILQLRQAQALQRFREIVNTGNQDYKSQIEKIYGVKLPQSLNNTVTYLGGFSSSINIQEVTNNNLADSKSAATLQGKGYGQSEQNRPISFDVNEHGCIMCIYHAVPIIDYALNSYHFDVTKTEVDDYANPVFDKLGLTELPNYYIDNVIPTLGTVGFVPRYYDYKTSIDTVQGAFRTTLPNWVAPFNRQFFSSYISGSLFRINYNFFKVNPHIVDSIFFAQADSSVNSDQLLINAQHTIKAVRNLDFTGLPY